MKVRLVVAGRTEDDLDLIESLRGIADEMEQAVNAEPDEDHPVAGGTIPSRGAYLELDWHLEVSEV